MAITPTFRIRTCEQWILSTFRQIQLQFVFPDTLLSDDWHFFIKDAGNQTGVYNSPTAVDRTTGKRSYAAAYYTENLDNTNFVILTGAQATKINFSPNKQDGKIVATGITFQINGTTYVVNATKEVILSAGVFQSPQYVIWPISLYALGTNTPAGS
jgi:choline dehydrogenase-like flavoprotein